jgi:uncharacterized protein (TIGR00297 family)
MLDKQGIALAVVMGILVTAFGGWNYLALMLIFFFLSVAATKYQHFEKREMGIYEHERSWENVFSNGFVPTVMAIVSPFVGPMPFICSVAATTSDKFASELGVLSGKPLNLADFKPAKPGTSGAVSILGFAMSLAGAMIIAVAGIYLFNTDFNTAFIVGVAGFTGSVVDSLFGIWEEKGIGTKGTTNIICSITGALIGFFIR